MSTLWATQQLAEFLAAVSSARTESAAVWATVERTAETLDAEVAAIVSGGEVLAVVGYPEGSVPAAELAAVTPGTGGELAVPGLGSCPATAVQLEHPPGATLVVARGELELGRQEAGLLRGIAHASSTTTRMLRLLDAERTAREEGARRQRRLEQLANEQAALRRVATLVGRAGASEDVLAAVTAEIGRLMAVDLTVMGRYDPDNAVAVLGSWTTTGNSAALAGVGRTMLGGRNVPTMVFETGRSARIDDYADGTGPIADVAHRFGIRSGVGVPINVEGRLWGVMSALLTRDEPFAADAEARLAGFTELVATAIANAQARVELRAFAEEQATLRRVATLVARGASPEQVFASVTKEVGGLLGADYTAMSRYDRDGAVTVLGTWNGTGSALVVSADGRVNLGGRNVTSQVFRTGRPARFDDYANTSGQIADIANDWGIRSSVGVPISVGGRLWGLMNVLFTGEQPPPADTEARLAGFTELVATAIANAESQAQLTASRARIVTAADHARRRIERDLHDGAQQRLVSLIMGLHATQSDLPPEAVQLRAQLDSLAAEAISATDELRELARGIHPAILADGGLRPALNALVRRCAVPVDLRVPVDIRLPEQIEIAAYYVISEALANTAKHANASAVRVEATTLDDGDVLGIEVSDDGCGGADPTAGSGLVGLRDRVEALRGTFTIDSPPASGTVVRVTLPIIGQA